MNDLDEKVQKVLIKSADDTKLSGAINISEDRNMISSTWIGWRNGYKQIK